MDTVVQGVNPLGEFFLLSLDRERYSRETIMKTCYAFTDDFFIQVVKVAKETTGICFYNKDENNNTQNIQNAVKHFLQLLNENEMRHIIIQETGCMHQEIIKKAFSPALSLVNGQSQLDSDHILTSAV